MKGHLSKGEHLRGTHWPVHRMTLDEIQGLVAIVGNDYSSGVKGVGAVEGLKAYLGAGKDFAATCAALKAGA